MCGQVALEQVWRPRANMLPAMEQFSAIGAQDIGLLQVFLVRRCEDDDSFGDKDLTKHCQKLVQLFVVQVFDHLDDGYRIEPEAGLQELWQIEGAEEVGLRVEFRRDDLPRSVRVVEAGHPQPAFEQIANELAGSAPLVEYGPLHTPDAASSAERAPCCAET